MSGFGSIAKENCRTCLSNFSENNGKCSLMNCLATDSDSSRLELMKSVMTTCSVTLFSDEEDEGMLEEIFICMSCVVEIDQMLDFLQKCIHSEAVLKQASQMKTDITSMWSDESQSENRLPLKVGVGGEEVSGLHSQAPNPPSGPPAGHNKPPQQDHQSPLSLPLLKLHHSALNPHPCLIRKTFQPLQLFQKRADHDSARLHQCRQCPEAFPSGYRLALHELKAHCPKKYSCAACKRTFATVSSLKFHENVHLKQPHSCTSCSKSFVSASVLRKHQSSFHPKSFDCHCGRSFNRKRKLDLHVQAVHEHKSRKYPCPDCEKNFRHPYSLKNHLNTHRGEKPFLCSACGSAFSALSNLTSHLRRVHSADRPPAAKNYLCHTCGDSFARAAHLQRHTLRKHVPNAERKHECPVCKKRFLEKSDVTGHVKLHDDVKPFACEQCSKSFRTGWRLQAHVNRVHLGLRPFECPTCSLRFKTKSHLEKHIRTHTGEKPFPCPHCSYTCAEKSNLKKHINVHLRAM